LAVLTTHQGQEGFYEVFCRRLTQLSEVTALAFDAPSNRLAVCNYNSIVQVFAMRSSSAPRKLFAVNIDNFVPKSIHFGAMRGNDREILVFGGHDGKMRVQDFRLSTFMLITSLFSVAL
jgi:hypothetical protein